MSRQAPGTPPATRGTSGQSRGQGQSQGFRVRLATRDDAPAVAAAARELLLELGGTPPATPAMEVVARALADSRARGALLVAEVEGAIVGVLGASWQIAIHAAGRYALIQDLWVDPGWRGRAVGRALLAALADLARGERIARIEVGLPPERYPHLAETEAFYRANGFTPLGTRMRMELP